MKKVVLDAEYLAKNIEVHHFDTTLNDEIKLLGWSHSAWGAEGEYLDKDEYRLQIVQQDEAMPSVINENSGIKGLQNLHIYHVQNFMTTKPQSFWQKLFGIENEPKQYTDFQTIYFGYCKNIEEFKLICNLLGI